MTDRLPPYDAVSESAVLGSVILDNSVLSEIRRIVEVGDFYSEATRTIYRSMCEVADTGSPIDIVTLSANLKQKDHLDKVGGIIGLSKIADDVVTPTNASQYAKIVRSLSIRRKLIYTSQEIAAMGYTAEGSNVSDYVSTAFDRISKLLEEHRGRTFSTPLIRDLIDDTFQNIIKGEESIGFLSTGIHSFDRHIGGLWKGVLNTFAGRTSMGKSTIAVPNIAVNVALSGRKVLIKSMEDKKWTIQCRILSRLSGIELDRIKRRKLEPDEIKKIGSIVPIVQTLPIWIDDRGAHTAEEISHDAIAHRAKHGLDLLVIDQLRHVKEREGRDLTEKTSIKTVKLAEMASNLEDTATLLLHQIGRTAESEKNSIPRLSHLKQSGEVEESSRLVGLCYRPFVYTKKIEDENQFVLMVAKNTDGPTRDLDLYTKIEAMFIGDQERHFGREGY